MRFVRRPVSLDYGPLSLSLSCFLPVSPPSHNHKSKTHQLPSTISPLSLPLLASLQLPLPSLFHSLICAPPKYHEYKSHSACVPPSLSSHSSFFSPLSSILRPLLATRALFPCCFRTGFLSADGVSLLCSFSSKGI